MQYFKGDATEKKYYEAAAGTLDALSQDKDDFFENAYEAEQLGDVLYESNRTPLANAILQEIYRKAFKQIFEAFVEAGTFESYLVVFRKIFGDNVDVTFTVPAPGKLNIDIVAESPVESPFITRYIQVNQYVFDNIVDEAGNQIVLRTIQGFESQYELEKMLFEMVPAGVFTTITLELLGA